MSAQNSANNEKQANKIKNNIRMYTLYVSAYMSVYSTQKTDLRKQNTSRVAVGGSWGGAEAVEDLKTAGRQIKTKRCMYKQFCRGKALDPMAATRPFAPFSCRHTHTQTARRAVCALFYLLSAAQTVS